MPLPSTHTHNTNTFAYVRACSVCRVRACVCACVLAICSLLIKVMFLSVDDLWTDNMIGTIWLPHLEIA